MFVALFAVVVLGSLAAIGLLVAHLLRQGADGRFPAARTSVRSAGPP